MANWPSLISSSHYFPMRQQDNRISHTKPNLSLGAIFFRSLAVLVEAKTLSPIALTLVFLLIAVFTIFPGK